MTNLWTPAIALTYQGNGAAGAAGRMSCKVVPAASQWTVTVKGPCDWDNMTAGIKGGATAPNVSTNPPVAVMFNGQGSLHLSAGQQAVSDPITLTIPEGDTVIFSVFNTPTGSGAYLCNYPYWMGGAACANADEYYKTGENSSNQSSVTGFNFNQGLVLGIASIDSVAAPPPPPPPPSGLCVVSDWSMAEANAFSNPPNLAFQSGFVDPNLNWATIELGSEVAGVSWIGQKFKTPQAIQQIILWQEASNLAINSVHVLYGDDPASLSVAGPFSINADANQNTVDLSNLNLGSHIYWRLRANASPSDRWTIKRIYMLALVNEWEATPSWVQAYIENEAWSFSANPTMDAEGKNPTAMTIIPMQSWSDRYNEFDNVNYRFIAKRSRVYRVKFAIQLNGNPTGNIHWNIFRNGLVNDFYRPYDLPRTGYFFTEIDVPLLVGDTLDARIQVLAGTNLTLDGPRCLFEID